MAIKVYVNDNGTPTLVEMAAESAEALAKLVSAAQAQDFTETEKAQARKNIGAFATIGGELTGQIINAIGDLIRQSKTDGYTSIKGGTDNSTGGYFTAYGKDHEGIGHAVMGACDGATLAELMLAPSGAISVNDVFLVKSINDCGANTNGQVVLNRLPITTIFFRDPYSSESEGGEFGLEPAANSALESKVTIDTVGESLRFFSYYNGAPKGVDLSFSRLPSAPGATESKLLTSWSVIPNYGAGVSMSPGFAAPSSGVVVIQWAGSPATGRFVNVNGVRHYLSGTSSGVDDASAYMLVGTGDVIDFYVTGAASTYLFYPLKAI